MRFRRPSVCSRLRSIDGATSGIAGDDGVAIACDRNEVVGQLRGAHGHAAPAPLLAEEERAVGARDQRVGALARLPFGDARGRAHGHALERALGHLDRCTLVGVDGDDRELVAAVARHEVVGPHGLAHRVADAAQNLVAGQMALALVDALEVVEIHHRKRQAVPGAPAALELAPQRVVERGVVEAARQGIGSRRQHQPGVCAGVAARRRGQVGERLQQGQVLARDEMRLEVADCDRAADLAVPVHRHGERAAHLRERRQRYLSRQCLIVVGQHRLVTLDALADEALADVDLRADHIIRQAVGGLDAKTVHGVAEEDVGVVGPEDAGGLLAHANQDVVLGRGSR